MPTKSVQKDAMPSPGAKDVFSLAWPMTLKAIFLHGTVVIDGFLLSSLGEGPLAAMGLAAALGGIVLGVIFAFSHAMQIRTAQAFGGGDQIFLKSVLASGLAVSLSIGVIGVAAIHIWGGTLINALAPSVEIAQQAQTYLSIFTVVIIAEAVGQCIASFFNGCSRSKLPLYGYLLSVPVNITISIVLIHGLFGFPALGVAGAALGSAIAITLQTAFWSVLLLRTNGHLRHVVGWHRGTFVPTVKRHMHFALPIAATFVSATLATHVCSLIYANMSLNGFAAMTLIAPWNLLAGQVAMQWTQATGILVAQLLGKRTPEDVLDHFLSRAWMGAFVAAGIVSMIFLAMCLSLDWIYPNLEVETRAILFSFLPILMIIQFPRATNAICGNTLRAAGDTVYVMHIFIWTQWAFRVPATALFVLYFDFSAFWILSLFLWEEVLKFPAFHRRLWRGDWKRSDVAA
ncbi:Na+-driven multidrug efflux pump [Litoreibacter ascidiaceicola]|uniref:Na+-driven multidrug efflux pump n=1 Tax=Litoreibacter ascidiaceicola TaxID=1486859 RepID=A0A1M4T1Y2_9RHOB|nr:MATE family efflux transporter [Litoreibacter ascidiaceicola]SHE38424.1 Na+-driven multidrug efflux pump [Litoreibacter ascidiaceicola]